MFSVNKKNKYNLLNKIRFTGFDNSDTMISCNNPGQSAPVVNDRAQVNYDGTQQLYMHCVTDYLE